ncbi:MAG: MarR family transcriptional regulator [Halioglobus sp.]
MSFTAEAQLVLSIEKLAGNFARKLEGALTPHGISVTEFTVLNALYSSKNRSVRRVDLAGSVGLSASGVTRMLRPMQKIGLVERDTNPRDARVSLVSLTSAGQRIFEEASISVNMKAESLLSPLTQRQHAEYARLTDLLSAA